MIDGGISDDWPQAVREAVERFALGDVVKKPPFFFGRGSDDAVWSVPEEERSDDVIRLPPEASPPFGVITTQTCDLNEQGDNPVHPFFQVAPVYDGSHIEGRLPRYLYELTGDGLGEGNWVADLRIEIPLDKGCLVGREPINGFSTEADQVAFAEALGRRRDRAALGNSISEVLDRQMSRLIGGNKNKAKRVFESVHGLGIAIVEGPRLEPVVVQLHVITTNGVVIDEDKDEQDQEEATELKAWFDRWWDRASEAGEEAEPKLNVLGNAYHASEAMDLAIYDNLIPFDRRP